MRIKAEYYGVMDASAILAYFQHEKGYKQVSQILKKGAAISTVNFSEVLAKVIEKGFEIDDISRRLLALGLVPFVFNDADAQLAAQLYPQTKKLGFSLGDRACLALSMRLGLPAYTADQDWRKLENDFQIILIR